MIRLPCRAPVPRFGFLGLHGALLDGRSLESIGAILAEAGDGLLPDLAGHGQALSAAPTAGWLDPATLGAELAARPAVSSWLQALPPDRPLVLLGHSLGALTALWLAARGPLRGRIERVILLDPPLLLDLSAPGHGELLFDLGCAIGSLPALPTSPQGLATAATVQGIAAFFIGQYRDHCAGREAGQQLLWLRDLASISRCDLLVGIQPHARLSAQGTRLDLGSLVGPCHIPRDLPLLHLHPISDAGHRLDTSEEAHLLIRRLLPGLGRAATH